MREVLNQAYSRKYTDERRMDIFIPESNPDGGCILFIHGGGWTGGSRTQWHSVARYFCRRGYTCVSAGYRFAPESRYPAQLEDVRLAMSFLKENAESFGFNPGKIAAIGSSAGGYLVLMLATIEPGDRLGISEEINVPDTRPGLAVCYCPVTTVHLYKELWKGRLDIPEFIPAFMGITEENNPELFKQASPTDRIRGGEPPVLFIHGNADTTVPVIQSMTACNKIKRFGGSAELVVLPEVEHGFGYGVKTYEQKESVRIIDEFLKRHFN